MQAMSSKKVFPFLLVLDANTFVLLPEQTYRIQAQYLTVEFFKRTETE